MSTPFTTHPESATIQIPSGANGARRSIPCIVESTDAKRLLLKTQEPLAISAALSVEYNDAMVLGEVMSCHKSSETEWQLDIYIEQVLTGLQNLMALRSSLLGEGAPRPLAGVTTQRASESHWYDRTTVGVRPGRTEGNRKY